MFFHYHNISNDFWFSRLQPRTAVVVSSTWSPTCLTRSWGPASTNSNSWQSGSTSTGSGTSGPTSSSNWKSQSSEEWTGTRPTGSWGCRPLQLLQVSTIHKSGSPPPQFLKTSVFSTNAQTRFALVVLDGYPGNSAPSAAHLTVSLFLCSSKSNTQGELRALEGLCVSVKSQSKITDRKILLFSGGATSGDQVNVRARRRATGGASASSRHLAKPARAWGVPTLPPRSL